MSGNSDDFRCEAIDAICNGFVNPSPANREIYRVIIEFLWPVGQMLPGPKRSNHEIRAEVNRHRAAQGKGDYQDPFRRVRELQGEEGLLGLEKTGNSYRLEHETVTAKRVPRRSLSPKAWAALLAQYGGVCASCGSANDLSPDHRKPRVRGGGDVETNIQPLCQSCNIFKSVACRGCQEDCLSCPWFDPKGSPLVTLRGALLGQLVEVAENEQTTTQELTERVLRDFLDGCGGSAVSDQADSQEG